ncbi:hypothetical protein EFW17_03510 [Halostreptopolyspora alba]|uniref:Uncharacterized protein n=1 Tax=Halostreptopolyspora alba TaxID=2487137 RepID=A0A3N0EGL6_9ACTN|nr:hypothetical protein EFW17_03510 [Nocardiopsaceae bacterium YIM 96095]
MDGRRLSHIGFAAVISCGPLFAVYAPLWWSGIAGYGVVFAVLIVWAHFVGRQYQQRKRSSPPGRG